MRGGISLYPTVNSFLQIKLVNDDETSSDETYRARVANIADNKMYFEFPMNEQTGAIRPLSLGLKCMFFYSGADKISYRFIANIADRQSDKIPLLVVQLPPREEIKKTQRRSDVRVPAILHGQLTIKATNPTQPFKIETNDISGGGISFQTAPSVELSVGNEVSGTVVVPTQNRGNENIPFMGEIVRVQMPDENNRFIVCSLKFTYIMEKDRDILIKYIFMRQLELKRKGML